MNTFGNNKPKQKKNQASANPFAKALAETEHRLSSDSPKKNEDQNPFSQALANTGSSPDALNFNDQDAINKQQEELKKKEKREKLKRKLHEQINPVHQKDIFSAREKRVKQEIENLRDELKLLVKEVSQFHKEVELTLMTEIVDPGQQGTYYINFFQQLRSFIMLLRQKVKSARTWAKQMHTKKKKKKRGGGLDFAKHETKTVHDTMHHERSNAFSGN